MTEKKTKEDFLKHVEEQRQMNVDATQLDPATLKANVLQLQWRWADFHLIIVSPIFPATVPEVHLPEEVVEGNELEFVYPIYDYGNKLSTSKAQGMYNEGMSQCKLYYTIEKMIKILIDKLKAEGIPADMEVQVEFAGFDFAKRKAFESVINLSYNVVVNNYDPGAWGEMYLQTVKKMAEKYGYPAEAPREVYRHSHAVPETMQKNR